MTNFSKVLLATAAACLLAFVVAGCGGGSVSSSAPKSVPDLTLPANSSAPIATDTTSSDTTGTGTDTATDTTATDVITGVPEDTTAAPDENVVPADTTADTTVQPDATAQQTAPDTSAAGGAGIQ